MDLFYCFGDLSAVEFANGAVCKTYSIELFCFFSFFEILHFL